jgi:kynurenine formamidase
LIYDTATRSSSALRAHGTPFSSKSLHRCLGDHAGTHVEAPGRFRFCGFPLKIKRGTASPIRAVAILDE